MRVIAAAVCMLIGALELENAGDRFCAGAAQPPGTARSAPAAQRKLTVMHSLTDLQSGPGFDPGTGTCSTV
eukprot:SAG22_NODE_1656_length_3888_cov_3.928477_2_plen_71_part_00